MSKLIGKRKQQFLAHIVRQEPAVDPDAADILAGRLDGAIRSLRISKAESVAFKSGTAAPVTGAKPEAAAPLRPATAAFDPYAFNAILTFKRGGRQALVDKLAAIAEITHLRQLAEAQLIGLDQDMRSGAVDIADLRHAVLRGVERLVADRRAAAS